jgi:hypothetical protein
MAETPQANGWGAPPLAETPKGGWHMAPLSSEDTDLPPPVSRRVVEDFKPAQRDYGELPVIRGEVIEAFTTLAQNGWVWGCRFDHTGDVVDQGWLPFEFLVGVDSDLDDTDGESGSHIDLAKTSADDDWRVPSPDLEDDWKTPAPPPKPASVPTPPPAVTSTPVANGQAGSTAWRLPPPSPIKGGREKGDREKGDGKKGNGKKGDGKHDHSKNASHTPYQTPKGDGEKGNAKGDGKKGAFAETSEKGEKGQKGGKSGKKGDGKKGQKGTMSWTPVAREEDDWAMPVRRRWGARGKDSQEDEAQPDRSKGEGRGAGKKGTKGAGKSESGLRKGAGSGGKSGSKDRKR